MHEVLDGALGGQVYFDRLRRKWVAITYTEKLGDYNSREEAQQAIRRRDALLISSSDYADASR